MLISLQILFQIDQFKHQESTFSRFINGLREREGAEEEEEE